MRGRLDVREIEDIGDAALSYNEVKALAAGNPLLMDKAEADAELTRLRRAERAYHRNQDTLKWTIRSIERRIQELGAVHSAVEAAIARRVETRGDAFTMTVGGHRHDTRHDAGEELKQRLSREIAAVRSDRPSAPLVERHGQLGGFEVTSAALRVLADATVTVALDGVPESGISVSRDELEDIDPGKLIVRLENRLHGLEAVGARATAEIGRIEAEAARAGDDLAKPFPLSRELAAARDRAERISHQLEEAARQSERSHGETSPDGEHGTDQVTAEQTQPSGPVATGTLGGQPEAVSVASRGFPAGQSVVAPRNGSARIVRLPAGRARAPTVQ